MARKRKIEEAKARSGMKLGALALMDALGFKGIWKDPNRPADVLRRMAALKKSAKAFRKHFRDEAFVGMPVVETRVLFVSDSIFLAAWPGSRRGQTARTLKDECLFAVELMALILTWRAVEGDGVKFRYRGVIGYGEFAVAGRDDFIVGPAVDEVASLEREAEGAFVWMAPSANSREDEAGLIRYDVPLKGGARYRTNVINPLFAKTREEAGWMEEALLGPVVGRLDIDIKRQNLADFLQHVRARMEAENGFKDEPPRKGFASLGSTSGRALALGPTPVPTMAATLGSQMFGKPPKYLGQPADEDDET
jgi:hypothetical protein